VSDGDDRGDRSDRGGGVVTGFLLGALAGVVAALLVTPKTGEDTRDLLLAKAREAADRARDAAGDVDLLERGRSIVNAARARLEGAISEGRDAAERQRSELEDQT
jgi:gas vesicle protein